MAHLLASTAYGGLRIRTSVWSDTGWALAHHYRGEIRGDTLREGVMVGQGPRRTQGLSGFVGLACYPHDRQCNNRKTRFLAVDSRCLRHSVSALPSWRRRMLCPSLVTATCSAPWSSNASWERHLNEVKKVPVTFFRYWTLSAEISTSWTARWLGPRNENEPE